MNERRRYWQQQDKDALIALAAGLVVWTLLQDESLVSPIINVIVYPLQFVLWGSLFPRQVDEWRARQQTVSGR